MSGPEPDARGLSDGVTLLASGGLDSSVLIAWLADRCAAVRPVFVRCGHPWEDAELAALRRFTAAIALDNVQPIAERSLPARDLLDRHTGERGYRPGFEEGYRANFIPGRNIALLAATALCAAADGSGALVLGTLAGSPYPDASPAFRDRFAAALTEGLGRPMAVVAPFASLAKEDVLRLGAGLPLELSLSCVAPVSARHCGDGCNKCAERQKAYALAGLPDPTEYARPPPRIDWARHAWPE